MSWFEAEKLAVTWENILLSIISKGKVFLVNQKEFFYG